jgi:hypothetical protein
VSRHFLRLSFRNLPVERFVLRRDIRHFVADGGALCVYKLIFYWNK